MIKITASDAAVLSEYQFISEETAKTGKNRSTNTKLLCVETDAEGGQKLSTVDQTDVTCFSFVKRFFGCGKLARKDVSLAGISNYLLNKDLTVLSTESQGYKTLHGIAARCLFYKKDPVEGVARLWQKISKRDTVHIHERTKYLIMHDYEAYRNYENWKLRQYTKKPGDHFLDPMPSLSLSTTAYHHKRSYEAPVYTTTLSTYEHRNEQIKIAVERRGSSVVRSMCGVEIYQAGPEDSPKGLSYHVTTGYSDPFIQYQHRSTQAF